jgi:hypothetical protein
MVTDDGCLPESPTPYPQAKTSALVMRSGGFPTLPKKCCSMRL